MMDIQEARVQVCRSGKRLLQEGLVARTWGNVSARVSDTEMIITPSGRPYAGLNPEDMVLVNFYTLAFEGSIKPSSELKLHCEIYKSRPHIAAVIHTHQMYASIVAAAQQDVVVSDPRHQSILGAPIIKAAPYGMPMRPSWQIMVVCALEKILKMCLLSARHWKKPVRFILIPSNPKQHKLMGIRQDLSSFAHQIEALSTGYQSWGEVSVRRIAIRDGQYIYATSLACSLASLSEDDMQPLTDCEEDKLIAAIFAKRSKINCLMITHQEYGSKVREEIPPILDDQAQLLGVSVRVAEVLKSNAPAKVVSALSGRFAAVCTDGRCLCIGGTVDDAYIAAQLLEKTSKAFTEARWLGGAKSINRFEAWAMQMYFQFKYAKEAKTNR